MDLGLKGNLFWLPLAVLLVLILFFPLAAGKILAYFIIMFVIYRAAKFLVSGEKD